MTWHTFRALTFAKHFCPGTGLLISPPRGLRACRWPQWPEGGERRSRILHLRGQCVQSGRPPMCERTSPIPTKAETREEHTACDPPHTHALSLSLSLSLIRTHLQAKTTAATPPPDSSELFGESGDNMDGAALCAISVARNLALHFELRCCHNCLRFVACLVHSKPCKHLSASRTHGQETAQDLRERSQRSSKKISLKPHSGAPHRNPKVVA